MKKLSIVFALFFLCNYCFAQRLVQIKKKNTSNVKQFELPRKVSIAFKKSYYYFDSINVYPVILKHISDNYDTLFFSTLNNSTTYKICFSELKYIRFDRSAIGYIFHGAIVYCATLMTVGLAIETYITFFTKPDPNGEPLPPLLYLTMLSGPFILTSEIIHFNHTFDPEHYKIREYYDTEFVKPYDSKDNEVQIKSKELISPFGISDSSLLKPIIGKDTSKYKSSKSIVFLKQNHTSKRAFGLPVLAKIKFKNKTILPITTQITNVTENNIYAFDLDTKIRFEINLDSINSNTMCWKHIG